LNFVNNFAALSVELLDELKEAAGPAIAALDADTGADIGETIEMLSGTRAGIGNIAPNSDFRDRPSRSYFGPSTPVTGAPVGSECEPTTP
jgi:hypothetical protein